MRMTLLDLSEKIDSLSLDIFEVLYNISASLDIPFFVVGAFVRDIILNGVYGIEIERQTADIDLGIYVKNWDQFDIFKGELENSRVFEFVANPNRFKFRNTIPVDIIPFGEISSPDDTIRWPPRNEIIMGTLGVEDAFDNALNVKLRPGQQYEFRFASLAGLALMKLIAWRERYPERKKDAIDFRIILNKYLEAGNEERIYNEDVDLIQVDYEIVGARLLGRDVAKICRPKTKKEVIEILKRETGSQKRYKLVEDMMESPLHDDFDEYLEKLESFNSGMLG